MTQPTPPEQMDSDLRDLVEELEKYRQIVETAGDAVVTINENHEVVYMNRAAEKMFGFAREELLGGDLTPLIPDEHKASHRHYVLRYLRTRRPRLIGHAAEVSAQRRDGSRFPMHISFSVAESSAGTLLTAIMRDMTEERELAQQVERSEKLAAVGAMVATVSHEIRTPLTLIGGFARQLAKEDGLSERGRRKVGIIAEEVARLEQLLAELNDLSRPQRYNWAETDLGAVVDHVLELMQVELETRGVILEVRRPDRDRLMVVADRDRLSQVLINLVKNALQASGDTPRLEIELRRSPDHAVMLAVRDCGRGVPSEQQNDIFRPFFTTKPGGTGLGLPVARRIVEEHGGGLDLDTSHCGGAAFTVRLPEAPADRTGAARPSGPLALTD